MKKTVLAFALVAASCAFASDKLWYPQSGSTAWSGRNWIGNGDCFEDGDNAVFSDYYGDKTASATVDTDVTAAKISASIPTTISKGEATTNSYTYFRFKIEGRKGNDNGMVQIAELKLYSGDTDITQENIQRYFDSSTKNVDNEKYPDNEAPYKLVDGDNDTKWLDRRLKDGSSSASLDAVWLAVGFSEPKLVTKYEWFTANDAEARDPAAWRLQGSNDNPDSSGAIWVDLDVRSGFTATSERKASAGVWTIDYSPTLSADEIEVSEGTTLTLGMAPVSSFAKTGAGTLVASAGHFERNRHAGGRTRLGRQFAFRHYRDSAEGRLGRILQRHLQHGQRGLDDRRRRPGGMGHWLTSRVHGRPEDRSFSRIGGPRMPPADKRRRPACHRLEQQLHPASRLWQDDHRDNRGRVGVRVQQRNIHDSVKRFAVPESSRGPSCH